MVAQRHRQTKSPEKLTQKGEKPASVLTKCNLKKKERKVMFSVFKIKCWVVWEGFGFGVVLFCFAFKFPNN